MSEWHVSLTRQFGRDGDTYGRHALHNPGGDNVQRDVLHVIPPRVRDVRRIHPTRFDADYIGAHRSAAAALAEWLSE
jgi:hypothetical protein